MDYDQTIVLENLRAYGSRELFFLSDLAKGIETFFMNLTEVWIFYKAECQRSQRLPSHCS